MKSELLPYMEPGRLEAGCDEAGRGPLAGPVYAAAVILPPDFHHPLLNDSKKMSEKARETLRPIIEQEAVAWAVEAAEHIEAIRRHGYTPWHRKSFHVKELEPSLF